MTALGFIKDHFRAFVAMALGACSVWALLEGWVLAAWNCSPQGVALIAVVSFLAGMLAGAEVAERIMADPINGLTPQACGLLVRLAGETSVRLDSTEAVAADLLVRAGFAARMTDYFESDPLGHSSYCVTPDGVRFAGKFGRSLARKAEK